MFPPGLKRRGGGGGGLGETLGYTCASMKMKINWASKVPSVGDTLLRIVHNLFRLQTTAAMH